MDPKSWEIWHDNDGVWLGLMQGEHCLELYGPFDTEARAEAYRYTALRS